MNPELEDYIESHISKEPLWLKNIDRKTNLYHLNGRMCSGHIQGRFLKMLTSMIDPSRVLELGTFTGYSALCMAEALRQDAKIDTIEANDEIRDEILNNFATSPHGEKITLHIGDALEVLDNWSGETFDLILIDADKREYSRYFHKVLPLLKTGGFIIADNTLWDGHVIESGKHSSQTQGIIDFNELVARTPNVEVAIIPMRDGVSLIRKIEQS